MQKWKKIRRYPDYSVSSYGRIRRDRPAQSTYAGRQLTACTDATGYFVVCLSGKWEKVHRIVAEAYLGKVPSKKQVNHKDGNKRNNSLSNLEIVTRSQNMRHIFEIGKHDLATLSAGDVRKIRSSTKPHKELSKMYNVSYAAILNVVLHNTWKGV